MAGRKGIILAGGRATRLYPVTKVVCKQLLAVYDKPMIYYPLSTLLLAGIKDILIITTPVAVSRFQELLGDGRRLGVSISYAEQEEPGGIAESFIIAEEFIGGGKVCLILGDNIFYGDQFSGILRTYSDIRHGPSIFAYHVKDPTRYGVVNFDKDYKATSITEKPKSPTSNWAVTGLYFYDNDVIGIAKQLKPSQRGELEITDINNEYLKQGRLDVKLLGRGYAWLDTGTHDSLLEASMFIKVIEERQGLKIGCIEESAFVSGFISADQLRRIAEDTPDAYREYLRSISKNE